MNSRPFSRDNYGTKPSDYSRAVWARMKPNLTKPKKQTNTKPKPQAINLEPKK